MPPLTIYWAVEAATYFLTFPINEDFYKEIERIFEEQGFVTAYEEIMKQMEESASNMTIWVPGMVFEYIIANQPDKAMDMIEGGYEIRDPSMPYISKTACSFDPLYDNPRFIAILEKMNLPLPEE